MDTINRQESLEHQLAAMRREGRRLAQGTLHGAPVWIKMAKAKRLGIQISKGPPRWLLAREATMLRTMHARGAPVPRALAVGDDYLVLEDGGRGLQTVLGDAPDPQRHAPLMARTGAALAALHARGCTHGRPYIRDSLVSTAGVIRFTDLERGARLDAPRAFQVSDLGFLILSIYARWPNARGHALADATITGYYAAAPHDMPALVARWCRPLRLLALLDAPLRWREARWKAHKRWREHTALPMMLTRLAAAPRALGQDGGQPSRLSDLPWPLVGSGKEGTRGSMQAQQRR